MALDGRKRTAPSDGAAARPSKRTGPRNDAFAGDGFFNRATNRGDVPSSRRPALAAKPRSHMQFADAERNAQELRGGAGWNAAAAGRPDAPNDDGPEDDDDDDDDDDGPDEEPFGDDGGGGGAGGRGLAHAAADFGDVSFEDLQRLRGDGGGVRAPRFRPRGGRDAPAPAPRANKNAPQELSSKRPVPALRVVIDTPRRERRDPRFESLCGRLDTGRFRTQFGFLYDEALPAEKKQLKGAAAKERDPERRAALSAAASRIDQQLKADREERGRLRRAGEAKKAERAAVAAGKAPFYAKKSAQKRAELVAKYEALKSAGQLDSFLAKRRKKNASRDRRFLPGERQG